MWLPWLFPNIITHLSLKLINVREEKSSKHDLHNSPPSVFSEREHGKNVYNYRNVFSIRPSKLGLWLAAWNQSQSSVFPASVGWWFLRSFDWWMDGCMENRNIVNYTILPTTAVKISLIWENVWTISTNEPQLRVDSLQKYLWFLISFFIYTAFVCSMELFPIWRNDQENYLQVLWKLFYSQMIYVLPSVPVAQLTKMDWHGWQLTRDERGLTTSQ